MGTLAFPYLCFWYFMPSGYGVMISQFLEFSHINCTWQVLLEGGKRSWFIATNHFWNQKQIQVDIVANGGFRSRNIHEKHKKMKKKREMRTKSKGQYEMLLGICLGLKKLSFQTFVTAKESFLMCFFVAFLPYSQTARNLTEGWRSIVLQIWELENPFAAERHFTLIRVL